MMERLKSLVVRAPGSPDLMIALVLVLTIAMMILPMPLLLVDLLIGFNLGFAVLLLMVSLYVRSPIEFSTLPGIILLSTVFRLALTITTTRLILVQADAGDIVRTFGEFVIAGSVLVGLVVFLIITVVQFIVIAKGAERVAEVGARFILDALPGKQMAIDAELRNGDIDQVEARRRRGRLEQESQLYGAMDGAMKFVKGDAIAGLVVIAVNLIGGIAVGTLSRGMPLLQAAHEYTLLTIGDALISQIPALMLSITAATVVTRVTGDRQLDLGRDIAGQLSADRRALRLAAIVLLAMGLIPGFPTAVFVVLALAFAAASLVARARSDEDGAAVGNDNRDEQAEAGVAPTRARDVRQAVPAEVPLVSVLLSDDLHSVEQMRVKLDEARAKLADALGILIPDVGLAFDSAVGVSRFRIEVEGVPVEEDHVDPQRLLLCDDPVNLELAGIPAQADAAKPSEKIWIDAAHEKALLAAGIGYHDSADIIATCARDVLARNAARFIGIQETRALLSRLESRYGDLVKEVARTTPVQKVADVLRRLVDEGVSVRNPRLVLEALAEWGEKEPNVVLLTEYVRAALKRQICHKYANAHRIVPAYMIERAAEDIIRSAVRDTAVGPYLVLEDKVSEGLLERVRRIDKTTVSDRDRPVILTSMDVRRFVRGFLVRNGLDIPVLSYQELASDFTIQPVGTIGLAGSFGSDSAPRTGSFPQSVVPAVG
ncbi:type III secretion system export apparatus subunit SctV [Bradyrhizobium sp. LHD-71]|uniref:type III secretion system export apparatus subunit SctV n=1 Tax=Bradyrhizobium sp. LHD-71 TaxID=3072141 RepID=UPI00280E4865|nr:type III secretion system export apparatus subunit SctV [Bradyrhizobium sp. LHD-71]MDQ8726894.1 type III secretion system export apparatus subunit SctV [Bradyrhizobium sp. LHD-71]